MPETPGPIGRFDHIGIAVFSIDKARTFFEDVLGAKHRRTSVHKSGDFRIALFDLHDFCIELLEPISPDGFLAKFLDRRGEGIHHLTLQVPDLEDKVADMEAHGIRVVDKTLDGPGDRCLRVAEERPRPVDPTRADAGSAEQPALLEGRGVSGSAEPSAGEREGLAPRMDEAPLAGVRIVDLSRNVAGPYASYLLRPVRRRRGQGRAAWRRSEPPIRTLSR